MRENEAQRASFEKWHKREFPAQPVEWQKHLGRYFYGQVQMRWEAYAAGAEDENEACLQVARAESESADTSEAVNTAIRIVVAIGARQEQERGKP